MRETLKMIREWITANCPGEVYDCFFRVWEDLLGVAATFYSLSIWIGDAKFNLARIVRDEDATHGQLVLVFKDMALKLLESIEKSRRNNA